MKNLRAALTTHYGEDTPPALADILHVAYRQETITFDEVVKIEPIEFEDVLFFAWNNKLLIPQAFLHCSEWDDLILQMEPGEVYKMPNISRYLLMIAADTGKWDIRAAVTDLYRHMGEPSWARMPDLVDWITRLASHYTVNAAALHSACVKAGIKNRTGAMIAILKGGGIISPKLGAFRPAPKSGGPLYEVNPSVYPRHQEANSQSV